MGSWKSFWRCRFCLAWHQAGTSLVPCWAFRWSLRTASANPLRGPRTLLFLQCAGPAPWEVAIVVSAWICRAVWRACAVGPENPDSADARVHRLHRAVRGAMVCPPPCPDGGWRGGGFVRGRRSFRRVLHGGPVPPTLRAGLLGPLVSGRLVARPPWVEDRSPRDGSSVVAGPSAGAVSGLGRA